MNVIVNIDVDDIENAITFYTRAFGFSLQRRLFDGTVAEMSGAPFSLYLLQKPARSNAMPGASAVRDYRRHWTPVHLDFEVADVGEAHRRALAAGAKAEGDITSAAWGRLARMSDPFGHGFCLVELTDQGYDVAADR